jgi:DNA-binding GntR family transcriptional regulator
MPTTRTTAIASPNGAMRGGVYSGIRESLVQGRYGPGEKLVLRQLADQYNVSLTPVREALHRLIAEGVLTQEHSRSVRVPVLSRERVLELRDIRVLLEGLAVERGAARATNAEVAKLERLAREVEAARKAGNTALDTQKVAEFAFTLYATCQMPVLLRQIEMLWLQTGPYIRLLHPEFIAHVLQVRPRWRYEMCDALRKHNSIKARKLIEVDVGEALTYLSTLIGAAASMRAA